jgi:hypothetical protein
MSKLPHEQVRVVAAISRGLAPAKRNYFIVRLHPERNLFVIIDCAIDHTLCGAA